MLEEVIKVLEQLRSDLTPENSTALTGPSKRIEIEIKLAELLIMNGALRHAINASDGLTLA